MNVTRWKHDVLGHMTTEPDGEYVAYADHARVLEEVTTLQQQLEGANIYVDQSDRARKHAEADLARVRGLIEGFPNYTALQEGNLIEFLKDSWQAGPDLADALAALLDARRKEA